MWQWWLRHWHSDLARRLSSYELSGYVSSVPWWVLGATLMFSAHSQVHWDEQSLFPHKNVLAHLQLIQQVPNQGQASRTVLLLSESPSIIMVFSWFICSSVLTRPCSLASSDCQVSDNYLADRVKVCVTLCGGKAGPGESICQLDILAADGGELIIIGLQLQEHLLKEHKVLVIGFWWMVTGGRQIYKRTLICKMMETLFWSEENAEPFFLNLNIIWLRCGEQVTWISCGQWCAKDTVEAFISLGNYSEQLGHFEDQNEQAQGLWIIVPSHVTQQLCAYCPTIT